jgi:hypothetical protein
MITDEEFNRMLNGPLAHPMPMMRLNRSAIALRVVLKAGGDEAEEALCAHGQERDLRDGASE